MSGLWGRLIHMAGRMHNVIGLPHQSWLYFGDNLRAAPGHAHLRSHRLQSLYWRYKVRFLFDQLCAVVSLVAEKPRCAEGRTAWRPMRAVCVLMPLASVIPEVHRNDIRVAWARSGSACALRVHTNQRRQHRCGTDTPPSPVPLAMVQTVCMMHPKTV